MLGLPTSVSTSEKTLITDPGRPLTIAAGVELDCSRLFFENLCAVRLLQCSSSDALSYELHVFHILL